MYLHTPHPFGRDARGEQRRRRRRNGNFSRLNDVCTNTAEPAYYKILCNRLLLIFTFVVYRATVAQHRCFHVAMSYDVLKRFSFFLPTTSVCEHYFDGNKGKSRVQCFPLLCTQEESRKKRFSLQALCVWNCGSFSTFSTNINPIVNSFLFSPRTYIHMCIH
jgi:hypothetical protein